MSGNKKRTNKNNKDNSIQSLGNLIQELTPKNRDINRSAFLGFLQSINGIEIDVVMVEGFTYRATYLASTPFDTKKHQLVLKGAKKLNDDPPSTENSTSDFGSTLILPFDQIKYITVVKSKLTSSSSQVKELETDVMLSKRTNIAELDGRDLQLIDSSWLSPETSASLETRHNSIGNWNQFEANKKLYNYQDTYDENIYTKKLDRTQLTREQLERADRIASQIENTTSSNFHLREERGQIATGEEESFDEEDRYSGVLRQPSPGTGSGNHYKNFTRTKGSPQGPWRKINVPNQHQNGTTPNTTPTHHTSPSSLTFQSNSFSSFSSSSTLTSTWGSKPIFAENSYKNALQSGESKSVDISLPPGFGKSPSTEGGYFISKIDSANIATNISFYGTIEPEEPVKNETITTSASSMNVEIIETTTTTTIATTSANITTSPPPPITLSSPTAVTIAENSQENSVPNGKSDSTVVNVIIKENEEQSNTTPILISTVPIVVTAAGSSSSSSDSPSIESSSNLVPSSTANSTKGLNVNAAVFTPSTPTSIAVTPQASISSTTNLTPNTINTLNTTTTTTPTTISTPTTSTNHTHNRDNNSNNYHGSSNLNGNTNGYSNRNHKKTPRNNNTNRSQNPYHNQTNTYEPQPTPMYNTIPMPYISYEQQHHMYPQPVPEIPYMTIPTYDQNYPVDYFSQPIYPTMMVPSMPVMINPFEYPHPEQQVMMMHHAPQFYPPHMMVQSVPVPIATELVGIENNNGVIVAPGLEPMTHNNDGN